MTAVGQSATKLVGAAHRFISGSPESGRKFNVWMHRSEWPRSAITENRGSFQRHGDWDRFGVASEHAMKLPRRNFLRLAAGATALPDVSRIAKAQSYPSRPVRIVVGFPPADRSKSRHA
jgi:hypothetical protein